MGDLGRKTGFVKFFEMTKGYGFIECDDDFPDIFFHIDSTVGEGYRRMVTGQRVSFFVVQGERGPQGRQVMLVDDQGNLQPVPPATTLAPQSRPILHASEKIDSSLGSRMSAEEAQVHKLKVDEQRQKYLADLKERAPNWVAAARDEQETERDAKATAPTQRGIPSLAGPPTMQPKPAPEPEPEPDDEPLRQGQRTYILAALEQIQTLARHADRRPGSLVQVRRLAANIELIIEAPDSHEALQFGDQNALNFDW